MSKVYCTLDDGTRKLFQIVCDICDAKISPRPDISKSGWTKQGTDRGPGTAKIEIHKCEVCSSKC
jgi:hypothetical protein